MGQTSPDLALAVSRLVHMEVRLPGAPDSLAIVSFDPGTGAYTQHYFDSRGVTRFVCDEFG